MKSHVYNEPGLSVRNIHQGDSGRIQQRSRKLSSSRIFGRIFLGLLALVVTLPSGALRLAAQQAAGAIQGKVLDPTGAVVPGANVVVLRGAKTVKQLSTDEAGNFTAAGLAPGAYTVRVNSTGFAEYVSGVLQVAASAVVTLDATLIIEGSQQQVNVTSTTGHGVSIAPGENASAMVLTGPDLDALPDDPEELASDLKALAGPTIKSKGAIFMIDGFTGGHIPPKDAIQEIRINQNPFSAEYSDIGFGRIEILTKPGSSAVHGAFSLKGSDSVLNSRNPYTNVKPAYNAEDLTGDLAGPLSQKASYFLDFEGRHANENEIINATVLSPALSITPIAQSVNTPETDAAGGGRVDYQLTEKNSLSMRYEYRYTSQSNTGVGGFTLPERSYNLNDTLNTLQLADSEVISNSAINETRLQFTRDALGQAASTFQPAIKVLDAFTGGGAQIGNSFHNENRWELQNYTSLTRGHHTLTFGGQANLANLYDSSPLNFEGQFVFSGGQGPLLNSQNNVVLGGNGQPVLIPLSSIQVYQRTLQLQQLGYSMPAIIARGGGASQFTVAGGQPASSLQQIDVGLFLQDDWRVSPSFSISPGFRWEGQNDIHDWRDYAPRMGLAWMPHGRGGRTGNTVIRLGSGVFYDRFNENNFLQTLRFNGITQQQFIISNPAFYPQVPSLASLESLGQPQTIQTLDPNLRSPGILQSSAGVEQQLPFGVVASVTYINTHGWNMFMSRNINAPLPGSGLTPFPGGNIYQYESAGKFNENQIVANFNRSFKGRMALFGRYTYNRAFSNTDGPNSFPANQYNLAAEYGRAATDIRHNLVLGGSLLGPFRTDLSPFLLVRSGAPFNIITGYDNNGDSLFTDRPAFATNPNAPGVVVTPYGAFNPNPAPGAALIPRNYAQGPGFASLNMRFGRTFGFGPESFAGGHHKSKVKLESTDHRYNLTVSVIVRNLFNLTNPGIPIGNLSSPLFNQSNWLAAASGAYDPAYGNNRRLMFDVRLSF